MRTTVTLDDDVVQVVEQVRRERGVGISAALNEVVRRGAAVRAAPKASFVQTVSSMGGARVPLDDVAGALELIEGPEHRG